VIVEPIDPASWEAAIPGLAALIVDAVDGGSSVNFLAGVTPAEAAAWWRARSGAVADGSVTVFVAREGERIVGSTLLARATQPNGPHRAEIGKVIVDRAARRRGVARALMCAAEERARADGRWLLMLDTETGSPAAALYESLGWQRTGEIPNFALTPDGELVGTTYYWKDLR
jgi:ribosomal protein S18 acetylase RimI-like enzyme